VLLLISCENGHVEAILESSLISAKRTAASAALAASLLSEGRTPARLGLIGTGVINFEIVRFLRVALPGITRVFLFDLDAARAGHFAERLRETGIDEVGIAPDVNAVLAACPLVSFATTASRPHVADLSVCPPGATILHISLRDLSPRAILAADNVVDDPDHVCRAQTSLHLAEQETGARDFIRCTLAEVCEGTASPRSAGSEAGAVSVFSPFGLGVLDLAVGKLVFEAALAGAKGTLIERFLPTEEGAV
jgi:ornithine cyclodeaminase/alanine dehydrogenase-like protein (mu-crystallin family)